MEKFYTGVISYLWMSLIVVVAITIPQYVYDYLISSYALMYVLYALFIGTMAYAVLDKRWIKLMIKRFGDISRDALITFILMLCFYVILVIPYLLSTTSLKIITKDHFFLMKNIIIGAFMFFVMVV